MVLNIKSCDVLLLFVPEVREAATVQIALVFVNLTQLEIEEVLLLVADNLPNEPIQVPASKAGPDHGKHMGSPGVCSVSRSISRPVFSQIMFNCTTIEAA